MTFSKWHFLEYRGGGEKTNWDPASPHKSDTDPGAMIGHCGIMHILPPYWINSMTSIVAYMIGGTCFPLASLNPNKW